ncbi:Uncharacterised protein [Acinetobacter baumannii]|nr:Uncharacterised protein [Acinetobacter baumannii]SSU72942.1 Uncharacterised protein [Acinetobacter baumannii]SSV50772.1 Uncharacterised protein [Acinetobacter baumannii]SUU67254.1 Uncharacterised protein [Acinetobacter baumannii]
MVTYGNDQNGLWLKFDNFTSNEAESELIR